MVLGWRSSVVTLISIFFQAALGRTLAVAFLVVDFFAAGSRGAYSPQGSYRNESSPHRGGSSRDGSRGMQRSASVGSDMDEHEQHAEQHPARHTEDAVLRQMNLHLMGRGHAKSARDA